MCALCNYHCCYNNNNVIRILILSNFMLAIYWKEFHIRYYLKDYKFFNYLFTFFCPFHFAILLVDYLQVESDFSSAITTKFQAFFLHLLPFTALMLQDQPPIPQYCVRMFADVANISPQLAGFLSYEFFSRDIWRLLTNLLNSSEVLNNNVGNHSSANSVGGEETDEYIFADDPQVAILIRVLFEFSSNNNLTNNKDNNNNSNNSNRNDVFNCGSLIEIGNLPTSIASACSISVFYSTATSSPASMESLLPLVDLLLSVLHFVIRALSASATEEKDREGEASSTSHSVTTAQVSF